MIWRLVILLVLYIHFFTW